MFTEQQLATTITVLEDCADWLKINEPYALATIRLFEDTILSLPAAPYYPTITE